MFRIIPRLIGLELCTGAIIVTMCMCVCCVCESIEPTQDSSCKTEDVNSQTSVEGNKPLTSNQPSLTAVALYWETDSPGRVTIDLKSKWLSVFAFALGRIPKTWGMFQSEIKPEEVDGLVKLVEDAGLHDFNPQSYWFGECVGRDVRGAIVFTWEDKEVALAIPPENLILPNAPEQAKLTYEQIEKISLYVAKLRNQYLGDPRDPNALSHIESMPLEDPRGVEFKKCLSGVMLNSLPSERKMYW